MNILNDLIYFTYIGTEEKELIQFMYETNKKIFVDHLNQLFDIEFRNILLEAINQPLIQNPEEEQEKINIISTDVANYLHSTLSAKGREYWNNRRVSDSQIEEYRLGDTSSLISLTDDTRSFFKKLYNKYKSIYVKQLFNSLFTQVLTANTLYKDGLAVCCPSFDSRNICRGMTFRILGYKKSPKSLKNIYKFYNPYSWSYMFNYSTVEKYDELILVEGVFDALALIRAGYPNTISPSMVRLSPFHTRLLRDKKLHILFDRDRGGLEGLKFINSKMENKEKLITLALCPSDKDFDEMSTEEIDEYMKKVSDYDVRNLTSTPVPFHSIEKKLLD